MTLATAGLTPHALRATIIGEVHARPTNAIATPARILHFAFETSGAIAQADRSALSELCRSRGQPSPEQSAKHHRVALGDMILRWEQHSEFTTYAWEIPWDDASEKRPSDGGQPTSPMRLVPQPGPLLVAVDVRLLPDETQFDPFDRVFNPASLAASQNADGSALFATDFQLDPDGFVQIRIVNRRLNDTRAGALLQNILDIETYRTLALLGLPEAQRLIPSIAAAEKRLAEITENMRLSNQSADNHLLLDQLVSLAADVEAGAAASLFRFGASKAYAEIVGQRLEIIGERPIEGYPTWSMFLARRMTPAMRTCVATEARQAHLSQTLARTANLLRTRVDVELEQQNQELLKSMNTRTQLQLRLQSTVEGLSVAAITYYVVALFSYIIKAAHGAGHLPIDTELATAIFIPLAAVAIWAVLSTIRRRHMREVS